MGASSSRGQSNHGKSQKANVKQQVTAAPPSPPTPAAYKWRIDGFSSLLARGEIWTSSMKFDMKGLQWFLELNPKVRKSGDVKEYVSLRLRLAEECVRFGTVVDASFKLLIYDQEYGKHSVHLDSHSYQTASTRSGTSRVIPLETLKECSSGFIVNNSCVFVVEFIKVVTAKDSNARETLFVEEMNETLFVRKVNAVTDSKVYAWHIEDFFGLKNLSYSPEFEAGGHKWSLVIYPSGRENDGDNNGNYLSLYLEMKTPCTLDKNTGALVEYSISIKNQETGKNVKGKGRSLHSKNAMCWGWGKFMTLEDFKDSSNGYLVKSKCCIEIEVAVIGSSKMEVTRLKTKA